MAEELSHMMVANSPNSNPQEIAAANEHLIEKFVKLHAANVVKATSMKYGGQIERFAPRLPPTSLAATVQFRKARVLLVAAVGLRDSRTCLLPSRSMSRRQGGQKSESAEQAAALTSPHDGSFTRGGRDRALTREKTAAT
jgi:hypothetical protein